MSAQEKTATVDYRLQHAINEIRGTYGDNVFIKPKSLTKFGRNDALGQSFETVWIQGGNETYATGNTIDSVSSSDSGDTQSVTVEGHTISGGVLTFVVQSVTLTGQDTATLATPLYRATRAYNNGSTDFAGTVYVYEPDTVTNGVPQTAAKIHLRTDGTNNQSLKCSTSTSNVDYWILTKLTASVNRQQSRSVDFRLQVRENGKVFRTKFPFSCNSSSGTIIVNLDPCLVVPTNSDIRIIAASSSTGTGVAASMGGYLAKVYE